MTMNEYNQIMLSLILTMVAIGFTGLIICFVYALFRKMREMYHGTN